MLLLLLSLLFVADASAVAITGAVAIAVVAISCFLSQWSVIVFPSRRSVHDYKIRRGR